MSALLLFGRTEELYSLLDSSKSAVWIMSFTGFIINQTWTIETYIIGSFLNSRRVRISYFGIRERTERDSS